MSFDEYFRARRRLPAWGETFRAFSVQLAVILTLHIAALGVMLATEIEVVPKLLFLLAWGALNCFWLMISRRPGVSAALSLAMIVALVLVSRLKHDILLLTANFVDVMIIDRDSVAFLLGLYPGLRRDLLLGGVIAVPLLVWGWRMDPYRIRARMAGAGAGGCLAGLTALSIAYPMHHYEGFFGDSYVSKFVRSGVDALSELMTHGLFESDPVATGALGAAGTPGCQAPGRRPHIIMVLDESSFDITAAPGIRVPPGYGDHFRSFDGKQRAFVVEGTGGPTWYTEYNVLTGLSARSFGHFAYFVTRIAAGRVTRGLPAALRRCGYRTYTLYPAAGAFLSARSFQTTTGIQRFVDAHEMGAHGAEPDRFYYDEAVRLIAREHNKALVFAFVYLAANHFPWDKRYRPELTPGWRGLGNADKIDEYVRRQTMSAGDYADFVARLKREFPAESFLLVRFGDHQPEFAERIIDPALDVAAIARRVEAHDPRYFTTYYAIDTINFDPVDLSSALDTLEAPYLPIVVQEAAGLPLDPSFAEQKDILRRCGGAFYLCNGGAEARRFNRLLIDAGLIKDL
ncbi:MAG TPA: sulfatase-like hydrolase/transferase [Xanthobacteraceae bacterium]|nr:sulfatase-like hydrolase/transferase [Xanthobacteraceae bacterium]